MSGTQWESKQNQNYHRMHHILRNVEKELRKLFVQEWNSRYPTLPWDNTSSSGSQLIHWENTRRRPISKNILDKFQDGDTNKWDCTVLFDAILYSKSIGTKLSSTIKIEVDKLRVIRNNITHDFPENKLSDIEFQTMANSVENALNALGLSSKEVVRIRDLYKSFAVLPPKPTHEVVNRSDKKHEITQDLQKLHCDNDGKLTYFYISGNPGSGKSQLARQVCEDIYNGVNWQTEGTFVMTLDGKDIDSLLYSYEDSCRRLNCHESVLQSVSNSSKPKEENIKDLRSQLATRIKNWTKWWIIVDNVESLNLISPLLPQMNDENWNNGQIILTTQNRTSVPPDSELTEHISLSLGMNEQECRQLLALLSTTDASDTLLDEVAEKLDRQPLAMAAAGVYMREVIKPNCRTDFSWQNYLEKLEKGKRGLTEDRLRQINSAAYSSTMSTAVSLAVEKCAENNIILKHIFHLFSLISFEPLPLDLVVKYIQQQNKELDAEDIFLEIEHCSLFVHVGNENRDIRLHRVVHEAVKESCLCKEHEINDFCQTAIPNNTQKKAHNIKSVINNVVKTMYHFKDREDKFKLVPHLKAFHTEMNRQFTHHALYSISLDFEKTEICQIYYFFGQTLRRFFKFKLSMEFLNSNIEILKGSKNYLDIADTYNELGLLHYDMGKLKEAESDHEKALKIRLKQLGPKHIGVAGSYNNLGIVCRGKGDLQQAGDYHQKVLNIKLEQLGPNHVHVAASYNNLGNVCKNKGDLKQAGDYYQKALKIRLEQLGRNHTKVAGSYNNLGNVCSDKGDLQQAGDYYQKALEIQLEQLEPNHIDVAGSYNNLGNVCSDKGDIKQAGDYHQKALEIQLERLGPNHIDVASSYNNLGNVCRDKGDLEQADNYYQKALEINLEQLGPEHTKVADSYHNLGSVCRDKGERERANYRQCAQKIRQERHGSTATNWSGSRKSRCILM